MIYDKIKYISNTKSKFVEVQDEATDRSKYVQTVDERTRGAPCVQNYS